VPAGKTNAPSKNAMKQLRARLSKVGVKPKFLNETVLPPWWEDSIADSPGGFREGASYVCARLGFSLASLLDADREPAFIRGEGVKYKKAKGVSEADVYLATHYAMGVARAVASAYLEGSPAGEFPDPERLRDRLLQVSDRPWVCLRHILDASWSLGIPVVHLRNLPSGAKKPDALTTMVGDRPVIVVLSQRKSPSWIAFIVAHELGHVHHQHLKPGQTLVDEKIDKTSDEKDEIEANDFAVRLLTGFPDLGLSSTRSMGISQLAAAADSFGKSYRIAPGVAALNYGFNTGQWPLANGAVSALEKNDDAATYLKAALEAHLNPDSLSEDSMDWITRATTPQG
jgi:hypothetical protein